MRPFRTRRTEAFSSWGVRGVEAETDLVRVTPLPLASPCNELCLYQVPLSVQLRMKAFPFCPFFGLSLRKSSVSPKM